MRCILFILFAWLAGTAMGQTLEIYKVFGGVQFQYDSLTISAKQVQSLLAEYSDASHLFTKARKNSRLSSALGFTGGLLVCIPVGALLIGATPEWGYALVGAALIGVSIPFNKAFERNAANAVDLFNQKKSARVTSLHMHLSPTTAGIRVVF